MSDMFQYNNIAGLMQRAMLLLHENNVHSIFITKNNIWHFTVKDLIYVSLKKSYIKSDSDIIIIANSSDFLTKLS